MNRILIGMVVALILALAGTGYELRKYMADFNRVASEKESLAEALNTSNRLRAADSKALAASRAAQAALKKEKAVQDEALSKALAANPDWAAQRVPDAVVDALGVR
jgi:hypothetical protein